MASCITKTNDAADQRHLFQCVLDGRATSQHKFSQWILSRGTDFLGAGFIQCTVIQSRYTNYNVEL